MIDVVSFLFYITLICILITSIGTMAAMWKGTPLPVSMAVSLFLIVFLLWGGCSLALGAVHLIVQGVKTLFGKG